MPTSKICPAVPSGVYAVRRRLSSTLCLVFGLLWLSAGWRAALAAPCTVTISPGASINSTLSAAGPGSVVCLNDGNYGQSVKFPQSGAANAWITLTAVNPLGATVKSVDINNKSYIEVDYLHVTGGSDLGISTQGGHHTRVIGNLVENMPGGGINLNSGDYRVIQGNVVRGCSAGTSGNTSAISIWEPAALDAAPGYHNYIGYNTVYSNHDPVGGTDGNGIIFDDANGTQVSHVVYLGGALIEEDLAWDNGGSGIKVYQSQNALVRNNTAYWNGSFNSNSATFRGDIQNENGTHNIFVNNVAIANSALNSNNTALCECVSFDDVWDNNVTYDSALGAGHPSVNGTLTGSGNLLGVNPLLINPPTDLHPGSGSPVIGAGSVAFGMPAADFSGLNWNTIDAGAYAYAGRSGPTPTPTMPPSATPAPTPMPSPSAVPTRAPIQLIQQVTKSCGGCTSATVPLTVRNGGSTLLLLVAINTGGATVAGVSDTSGGAWTPIDPAIYPARAGADNTTLDAWIASNHSAGASNVTVTLSGKKNFNLDLLEYTGLAAASPLDADTKSRDNLVTGTINTGNATDLLVGAVSVSLLTPPDGQPVEYGSGGGIPAPLAVVNGALSELIGAAQVVTAKGNYGFRWTGGLTTVGMIFALKGAGGAPTPLPTPTGTHAPTGSATPSPKATATPSPAPTSGAQQVGVSPTAVSFGSIASGTMSAAQMVTVSNSQPAAISLSASLGGSNPSQFAISSGASTCGAALGAGASCVYAVMFKPKSARAYSAALKIKAAVDSNSPHTVALSGTGF